MKKIVALVLSLVMVLGLATTAFAAADEYDLYLADKDMAAAMKLEMATYDEVTIDEVGAKTNKDTSGNVAYLVLTDDVAGTVYAVKTATPTITSYAVCEAGKTAVLYYVDFTTATDKGFFEYSMPVTAFTSFGLSCGQVNNVDNVIDTAEDYFLYPVDGKVYLAGDATASATYNFLLNGEVVSASVGYAVTDHTFVANDFKYDATLKTNVPTSAICTTCLETSTAIYKDGKVPATMKPYTMANAAGYRVVVGAAASAPAVDGEKVESAETFDAGIAMYVGMSVMAAAGSAVVLKKKD